ncbi:oligopeptide transport system permease protein [Lachnospiraceae bacterium XBB1006]|nr:oligopeptide transport system permease protein [Lachnospiraceae bacterium XBB1006]
MTKYVIKRLVIAIFTILIIASLTFLLMNAVPGSPFLTEHGVSDDTMLALEAKYGMDKPLPIQLKNYLVSFVQGDMGVSIKMQKNRPVSEIILEKFPVSVKVGIWALIWSVTVGIVLGCLAAHYRGKVLDSILRVVSTVGIAIPGFVVASLLLIVFGVKLRLLPTSGLDSWQGYLMPAFALGFYPMCYIARLTRSSMLDVIHQDYIRTAKAKGLGNRTIVFKHALRNSLIPVVTYLGPLIAYLITGGFVVETVFAIPGLGKYFVQSIMCRDYPIIMGTTILLAVLLVIMMVVVDIVYKLVDPRIQLGKGGE